jgi:hypothetical protein
MPGKAVEFQQAYFALFADCTLARWTVHSRLTTRVNHG